MLRKSKQRKGKTKHKSTNKRSHHRPLVGDRGIASRGGKLQSLTSKLSKILKMLKRKLDLVWYTYSFRVSNHVINFSPLHELSIKSKVWWWGLEREDPGTQEKTEVWAIYFHAHVLGLTSHLSCWRFSCGNLEKEESWIWIQLYWRQRYLWASQSNPSDVHILRL